MASTTLAPLTSPPLKADSNLKLMVRPALNVFYVGMNNTYPPFDNEQVRQAIAMCIDRQRIVDNFYPAGSEVATHFTPCAIPNGCVARCLVRRLTPPRAKEAAGRCRFPRWL